MRAQVAERDERLGAPVGARASAADGADASGGGPRRLGARAPARRAAGADRDALRRRRGRQRRRVCARCSRELGVHTIDGGPTLNPSTYDLLAAIHDVPAEEVVVLPNSAERDHGRRARRPALRQAGARRAARRASRRASRRRSRSRRSARSRRTRRPLTEALAARAHRRRRARPRATTRRAASSAARRSASSATRCIAWGEPLRDAAGGARARWPARGEDGEAPELISVLAGEEAPLGLGELELDARRRIELELRHGGQSAYWWLLAAE